MADSPVGGIASEGGGNLLIDESKEVEIYVECVGEGGGDVRGEDGAMRVEYSLEEGLYAGPRRAKAEAMEGLES